MTGCRAEAEGIRRLPRRRSGCAHSQVPRSAAEPERVLAARQRGAEDRENGWRRRRACAGRSCHNFALDSLVDGGGAGQPASVKILVYSSALGTVSLTVALGFSVVNGI